MATTASPTTLCEVIDRSLERHRRDLHYGFKRDGAWLSVSSDAMGSRMRALRVGLSRLGVTRGDRVAILSPTRIEWSLAEYAILGVGAVVVPIYPTSPPQQVDAILRHSGARALFVADDALWRPLVGLCAGGKLEHVVGFEPVGEAKGIGVHDFERLIAEGNGGTPPTDQSAASDLASIIYTSGTTGEPKGVMLSHGNIVSNVLACTEACPFSAADIQLSFLPLSHIFERMVHFYFLWNGLTIYYAEDVTKLGENLLEVRPTVLTAVPRVLEKVLGGIEERSLGTGFAAAIARMAVTTGRLQGRVAKGRETSSVGHALRRMVSERLVFAKIRAKLGGRLRVVVTGGAATPDRVTEFFTGAGIEVLPGYGLTEASPVVAFNTMRSFRYGTVGPAIPGTDVRIASDGEIEVHGPGVMQGYYQNEAATKASISADGWLRTGDIGGIDEDGFLSITDRKKNLLVTSHGKNIAPQPIEERLAREPLIHQVMLVGDGRPFISALIVPGFGALEAWAREHSIDPSERSALLDEPRVIALYEQLIARRCEGLARHETVKRFALLDRELTEAEGELTPTQKIKRRVVEERCHGLIEGLYA